jgi:hypothetical protein
LVSLRQREWDRVQRDQRKQIKRASDEMRFNGVVSLFFHLVSPCVIDFFVSRKNGEGCCCKILGLPRALPPPMWLAVTAGNSF